VLISDDIIRAAEQLKLFLSCKFNVKRMENRDVQPVACGSNCFGLILFWNRLIYCLNVNSSSVCLLKSTLCCEVHVMTLWREFRSGSS
jgi:hypothetical protein